MFLSTLSSFAQNKSKLVDLLKSLSRIKTSDQSIVLRFQESRSNVTLWGLKSDQWIQLLIDKLDDCDTTRSICGFFLLWSLLDHGPSGLEVLNKIRYRMNCEFLMGFKPERSYYLICEKFGLNCATTTFSKTLKKIKFY